jgi:hypothetical protein
MVLATLALGDEIVHCAPMKIEFVIWQFVRVMVELESLARPRGRNARDTFRARNTGTWNALDKELKVLGEADATKYAKRMMKDTIVINTKTPAQVVEVSDALGRVINHMGAELRRSTDDAPAQRSSLMFEQTELKKLRARLAGGPGEGEGEAKGKPKPNAASRPSRKLKPTGGKSARPQREQTSKPKPKTSKFKGTPNAKPKPRQKRTRA